ncbi:MAG: acyl-CoA dehydrogenase [Gammaproteobacteria bacterium]|nr:acyl-CoA dehydrogenase [Gammaproteobacteria bacterium]
MPCSTVDLLGRHLQALIDANLDRLPLPGQGQTLTRWRSLAQVAGYDLSLVKLYEGHTDALAIMAELNAEPAPAGSTWGMWAAEPPNARVRVTASMDGEIRLNGRKAWCSGAPVLSHTLMTAWNDNEEQCLVAVALRQPGVRVTAEGWQAIGMRSTASVNVVFEDARARLVGDPGDYVNRPGFWQGGAGITACWYGAATSLGETLREQCAESADPHRLAHLGATDAALSAGAAVLRECADWIDKCPQADASAYALRTRAVIENVADTVMRHVGRALGAGPFCQNARFASLMADLPVFMRQSHAERDLAALGERVAADGVAAHWRL